jgi:hypothetical protein
MVGAKSNPAVAVPRGVCKWHVWLLALARHLLSIDFAILPQGKLESAIPGQLEVAGATPGDLPIKALPAQNYVAVIRDFAQRQKPRLSRIARSGAVAHWVAGALEMRLDVRVPILALATAQSKRAAAFNLATNGAISFLESPNFSGLRAAGLM